MPFFFFSFHNRHNVAQLKYEIVEKSLFNCPSLSIAGNPALAPTLALGYQDLIDVEHECRSGRPRTYRQKRRTDR
jgi:hypothetical protein